MCNLAPETVAEIDRVTGFVEEHKDLSRLTTAAIKPLMRIKDPEKRQEAVSIVEKTLNRKTPTGGVIKKRLTKPEIEKIIEKVLPSETPKIDAAIVSTPVPVVKPEPKPLIGMHPVSFKFTPTLPITPPPILKTQEQIRKEKMALLEEACELMLDRMSSTRFRGIIAQAIEDSPREYENASSVIAAALDLFNARKK